MKNIILKIKGLLGFCQFKGCKQRSMFDVEIPVIKAKRHICEKHAQEIMSKGTLKGITYEHSINFDSQCEVNKEEQR